MHHSERDSTSWATEYRDYSAYDMSWVGPPASLISTVADLNRFYSLLLAGHIISRSSLAQMQQTVPVISFEGKKIEYGLGPHKMEIPSMARSGATTARCGRRSHIDDSGRR